MTDLMNPDCSTKVKLEINFDEVGEVLLKWNYEIEARSWGIKDFSIRVPKQKIELYSYLRKLEDELSDYKECLVDDPITQGQHDPILDDITEVEAKIKLLQSIDCQLEIEEFVIEIEGKASGSSSFCLSPARMNLADLKCKFATVYFSL